MKTAYTEEAVADIVSALTYLAERSPAAAAKLDADIQRCIDRLAAHEFDGPVSRLNSGAEVQSWPAPPFAELLIVRVYHQARRPIAR